MSIKWVLFGIAMSFDALFLVAISVKFLEVRRARLWLAAPGRIRTSRTVSVRVDKMRSGGRREIRDTELRSSADVTYEFTTPTGRHTGHRVSMSEDPGGLDVARKLSAYPRGKPVTVF